MDKVTIIVPSRNEPHLSKTIDDLYAKAHGLIEVIVMLDGYWPSPTLKAYNTLMIVHLGAVGGMRHNINAAARVASGKYLMKCDAHCIFAPGFDEDLKVDCEEDWLVVPRRFRLTEETWEKDESKITDYMYISPPDRGFKGVRWKRPDRDDYLVDDLMSFQGSCWFMHTKKFMSIGLLDENNYSGSGKEAQEIGNKIWLSGGRCVVNKKTWYAHLHKKSRGFNLPKGGPEKSRDFAIDTWVNNKWIGQVRDFQWLLDKFWPVPHWEKYLDNI